ncbi:hypothetical protein ACFSTE_14215 [Aquimarina hainanensis]|uniref:DUF4134 domain-containing protein n=1 Tax=Aquimarina hainanensis TaxID=1578017 RepID=A0ABW5NAS8_9FLAO|nr:hypothetical protein [Aquimarina sp. TRL1]QKX06279.1 hypothetical protein HN014_15630 [Aquimarina sp. TRL1]
MTRGVLSVLIACCGFYLIHYVNYETYQAATTESTAPESPPLVTIFYNVYKILTFSMGLLSLYMGIISYKQQYKYSYLGIVMGIFLLIITFVPFWKFFL